MDKENKILLIRDSSELSSEVENYLIKAKLNYNVFYSNKKDFGGELPVIFDFAPYRGKVGFYLFKEFHPLEKNIESKV